MEPEIMKPLSNEHHLAADNISRNQCYLLVGAFALIFFSIKILYDGLDTDE